MPNKKINALDVKVAVSTDLMLVGDPSTGTAYKSTLATLPLVPTSRTITINGVAFDLSANRAWTIGTVTSVGLSMPNAFGVANSPITSSGTLAVTALGTASQYIRGDGELATFPSTSSGGSSVNYYLNGSVNSSVAGYKQLGNTATIGAGTDFTLTGNGLIAQFLTDVGNPNRIEIPGGAWNFEMYFQVSSSGGSQKFYVELLKYDGTTFTSIASSSAIPEQITGGTAIDLYLTSLAVPTTTLLVTDRLAIRVYIVDNSGGRTITLHTEDNTLCEIITTFAGGVSALNGITANTQYFATGTSGTDFGISSVSDTHTFNLPTASATNRGALSSADWSTFNNKVSTNIYNGNGTLTSARALTLGGFSLDFIGSTHTNRLTSAGRLLLGTTTELTYLLHVNGTSYVSGASLFGGRMQVQNSFNPTAEFQSTGGNTTSSKIALYGPAFSPVGQILCAVGSADTSFPTELRGKNGVIGIEGYWITTANTGSPTSSSVAFYAFQSKSISINSVTEYASAQFAIDSTTKGFLPPRMTTTQRDAIASPATGLVVYNTTLNSTDTYDGARWRTDADTTTTNRQTASYSLVLADRGKLVEMNSASANTLTIPLNSSIAFPIGSKIDVTQYGAGATTITATSGVTIRSFTSFLKIAGQYAACTLVKIGTDEWYCYGNLIA